MQTTEPTMAVPRTPLVLLLAAAFFVSPIVFFTGFTRNPYFFQIALLNVSLLGAFGLFLFHSYKRGRWLLPVTAAGRPVAALILIYAASFAWAYFWHEPFFRPAMLAEGLKAFLFFLVNCAGVFFLSVSVPYGSSDTEVPAGKWLSFILLWGALWFLFPWLKMPAPGDTLWARFFDPYGFLLWATGFTAVALLIKRCRQEDILHLALSAGAVAALYGILQYFRIELVWAKLLNPYGNRSVSTFGNPNFISTYIVILMPLAASLLMKADTGVKKAFYGLVFLSYEGMLMASLTRSSWLGAAAGFAFLFSLGAHRAQLKANRRFLYPFFGAALLLLFLWPSDSLKPMSSGLVDRVTEAASGIGSTSAVSLSGDNGRTYSSFHQRLLIWTSAWQMGLENPVLGKGWGQFELFYPFYQGNLMANFPVMRSLRTHANNAHNEILEQWSQAGIAGLGAFIWLLAVLGYGFFRFYRSADAEARYSAVPLAAGLVGALTDNMLNVSLHFAVPALAFWWVAGALALKTAGTAALPAWKRPAPNRAAAGLLLLFCAAGVWFWYSQVAREFYYFKGFRDMRRGALPAALDSLGRAYKAHPREVNSNYEYGNAFVRSGELEKGVWAYGEALKSNAGYDEIYFNLGVIQKRLGKDGDAKKSFRVSGAINPLNRTVWQALTEMYLSAPDKEAVAAEAVEDLRSALKVFQWDPPLWNALGYFYTLQRDYKNAREAYVGGVRSDPTDQMLKENLAGVSRQLGMKNDPALKWLAEYARLTAASNAGTVTERVLADADALAAGAPGAPRSRLLRAKLYFRAGRLAEARAALSALLAENYSDNQARYGLAVIYEKEGEKALARAEWERFLQLEPGNEAVKSRLAALR